jgi:ankyrin repeat protein
MLLEHGAAVGFDLTPLHLLACWSPARAGKAGDSVAADKDSSSSKADKSSNSRPDGDNAAAAAESDQVKEHLDAANIVLAAHPAAGGSVDAVTEFHGDTPLTLAATTGATDVARLLLQHGADCNMARSIDAVRPIDIAVYRGNLELAVMLLEHGADVSCLRCSEWD